MATNEDRVIPPQDVRAAVAVLFERRTRQNALKIAETWAQCWDDVGREDLAHEVRQEVTRH